MKILATGLLALLPVLSALADNSASGTPAVSSDLSLLTPGTTAATNALWMETPPNMRFTTSKTVVVADIKGPGAITMMHFAYPQKAIITPPTRLNRDLLLRIYWDGETTPSVDCPLVDFFCDPAGTRDVVNTAFVNMRRGFNTYFPMPFHKSAKVELVYQGSLPPGDELYNTMPCYSYVMYRLGDVPANAGYFHASWRQQTLLLAGHEYVALEATGKGKFVGWNVTVQRRNSGEYPVDENEKFYIDGEKTASIEFQGFEDSFGFSWGFPESENSFPFTGYFPFFRGAAAYRFFAQDAISFQKSLKVAIGFGVNENPWFNQTFSKPGNELQFSSTVYWYQTEPAAPLPPMLPVGERAPEPNMADWMAHGVKLEMLCGQPDREVAYAAPGYNAEVLQGTAWKGWSGDVDSARTDDKEVKLQLDVPKATAGTVRVFIIDPDKFAGGRNETVTIAGQAFGPFTDFQAGHWVECVVSADKNTDGKIQVSATNEKPGANAVISKVEWVEAKGAATGE